MNSSNETNESAGFGVLSGARKDEQSITAEWQFLQRPIQGIGVREMRHVTKENGYLTEIWRSQWEADGMIVDQVFQVMLKPGGLSAWHTHRLTTDRLFANYGAIKIVLFDGRPASPTHGLINVFRVGTVRPALITVPPGVWHGVQNIGDQPALLLNLVDRAYRYEDPDHWRLPQDTDQIPYRFE